MNTPSIKTVHSIAIVSIVAMLSACGSTSESSSPWVKSDSPWGKRTAAVTDSVEAPVTDTYKDELITIDTATTSGVDMGYQAEKVESVVPEEAVVEAPVIEPVVVDQPATESAAPAVSAESGDDFRDVPASYYTLQVLASVDENAVYTFARKHGLSSRYVLPTVRGGTTWYVLLLDVYPSKAAARAAMDETVLPTTPWMRTVGSVQQLMP